MLATLFEQSNAALARGNGLAALEPLRQALALLPVGQTGRGAVEHNFFQALRLAGTRLLAAGQTAEAVALGEEALAQAMPTATSTDDPPLRPRAEALRDLSQAFLQARQLPLAVRLQRAAIAVYPCPTFQIDLTNLLALSREPAVLTDFCDTLRPEELAPHLFIACLPKSGSSFLRNALLQLTGFRDTYLFYAGAPNEHDLYLPSLLEFATVPTVTQQHARASEANVHLMQGFGLRPVVLVRNLFDALVSLDDFYHAGASFSTFFFPDYLRLSPEERMDLIVDHVAPWYLQFYASWVRVEQERRLPLLWLTYEEMIADKAGTLRRLCAFWNLPVDEAKLTAALGHVETDRKATRFNQGVTGRGQLRLSPAQRERILRLTSSFPLTSFARLGIPSTTLTA